MHSNGKNNSQDAKGKWKEWWASISFCDALWYYINYYVGEMQARLLSKERNGNYIHESACKIIPH